MRVTFAVVAATPRSVMRVRSGLILGVALACGAPQSSPHLALTPPPRPPIHVDAPPAHADWLGIIGTGQSLSVGAGAPAITRSQPFHNLKLVEHALVPLVEPIRPRATSGDGQYPGNILGETPHSAMANQLTSLSPDTVTLHSVVGWSGHCLNDIDKRGGGLAYPSGLEETRLFKQLAKAEGKTFATGAVILTHGECDSRNENYESSLYQLWQDYNSDLIAISGQNEPVVLLLSQQHSFPLDGSLSASTVAQWSAGVKHPGKIICVGPKYQYIYTPDRIHLDAPSYIRLGEKYAEVFDHVVRLHQPWQPLQPEKISRDGRVLTVTFHVPNPPLAWDETLDPPHQGAWTEWANGRGFEVLGDQGALEISQVDIHDRDILITLRSPPVGPITVRYAMVQDAHRAAGGDAHGRRGQLRDSDPFVGLDAQTLACRVVHGSNMVTAIDPRAFEGRTARDLVNGPNLQGETIIREKSSQDAVALSSPWEGPTGEASLEFHYDHRNYAVAFRMMVP